MFLVMLLKLVFEVEPDQVTQLFDPDSTSFLFVFFSFDGKQIGLQVGSCRVRFRNRGVGLLLTVVVLVLVVLVLFLDGSTWLAIDGST